MSPRIRYVTPARKVQAEFFPVETIDVINLPPFRCGRYRVGDHIGLVVKTSEENVIIRSVRPQLFSYADTYYGALENFKSLLVDYYKKLRRRRKTLGANLKRDLEYLESIITPIHEKT